MVKATVKYTEKHIRQLYKRGAMFRLRLVMYICVGLHLFVYLPADLLLILIGGDNSIVLNLIFLVFWSACLLYTELFLPQKSLKRREKQFPNSVTYLSFEDGQLLDVTKGDGLESKQTITYDRFDSCREKKGWFTLYISKDNAYIINHTELTEGTPEELRAFLRAKLGNKFRSDKN